ncbi:MAG: hypothetical protein GTO18_04725 [Anaerolineales bacterium]|nr:hypothetical protein [Anaerolineales bacterium]
MTSTPTATPTETSILEGTDTATPSSTAPSSATPTSTPSQTPNQTPQASPFPVQSIIINEVAWAGSVASPSDEWIELRSTSADPINLAGWTLSDGGDINVALSGTIPTSGYYLLERTDDSTISDITASKIYTGSLKNSGETLKLKDPSGAIIDTANVDAGPWPAGDTDSHASMERRGGPDQAGNWGTFTGVGGCGHDAAGNPIRGTPGQRNSQSLPTPTATFPVEPTPTPTPTLDPVGTSTPVSPQRILINEVAWAGTIASSGDEWIELHNPSDVPVVLDGWTLSDGVDIHSTLSGSISPHGFYLMERSDDSVIANFKADHIFNGGLRNSGDTLWLRDPSGTIVDCANGDGSGWPGGDATSRASMERVGGQDQPSNWGTFTGYHGTGIDIAGNPIQGTPRSTNSVLLSIPPYWRRGKIRINEVLIRPHYDWEGSGGLSTADEFIELYNVGPGAVFLKGWILDDVAEGGSKPYVLPGLTLRPGSYLALFHSKTGISLNDSGDSVRLIDPDGRLVEEISYLKVKAYNLSYGRLPDGSGHMAYGLWPTPGEPNIAFQKPQLSVVAHSPPVCPFSRELQMHAPPQLRIPPRVPWMASKVWMMCDYEGYESPW